jgi:hypothetical protein
MWAFIVQTFAWAIEAAQPIFWASLSVVSIGAGLAGFFFFDLVALADPNGKTVSQLLREFLTWGPESRLIVYGLPILALVWFVAHLENGNSP